MNPDQTFFVMKCKVYFIFIFIYEKNMVYFKNSVYNLHLFGSECTIILFFFWKLLIILIYNIVRVAFVRLRVYFKSVMYNVPIHVVYIKSML